MVSEPPLKRPHQDAFPDLPQFRTPTACKASKTHHLDTPKQDSGSGGGRGYQQKAMGQWRYDDVVSFFMDSLNDFECLDFNFSAISGVRGFELASLPTRVFQKFSPKHWQKLYELVQVKARQDGQAEAIANQNQLSLTTTATTTTSTTPSSPTSPPYLLTTTSSQPLHLPHHLQPQTCDAQAPYELRIEPPPQPHHQHPHHHPHHDPLNLRLQRGLGGLEGLVGVGRFTPTAPLKSPPPLMSLEGVTDGSGQVREGVSGQEEVKVEPPKKRGPGRPKKPENELKKKKKKTGRLWEFIRDLLLDPKTCPSLVRWENAEEGLFRFIEGEKVAKKWGDRKKNGGMNYEKLSRAMRYYYKTHIFEAVHGRRLVYKFGVKAKGWRPANPNFESPHHTPTTTPTTTTTTTTQEAAPQLPLPHHTDTKPHLSLYRDLKPPPQPHHSQEVLLSLPHSTTDTTTTTPPLHHHHHHHHHLQAMGMKEENFVLFPHS